MIRAHFLTYCCVFSCLAVTSAAQQPELNARDAFWSASDLVGKRTPAAAPRKSTASTNAASSSKKPQANPSVTVVNGDAGQGGISEVSQHAPLGLRYSVLKRRPDGTFEEVSPDTAFHAGESIRLSVMSNQGGYLYIIQKGTSGKWQPLYPPPGQAETKLIAGTDYLIPGGQDEVFKFKGEPGEEKLFVLLTRTPETNLDDRIQELRSHQTTGINEQVVAQLRQEVQSRDLVFTKSEDDDGAAPGGDKATYVVNKATNNTPDPHIVVDVVLSHK